MQISYEFPSGTLAVRADFNRPESPLEYMADDDGNWKVSPFKVADTCIFGCPDKQKALTLVNRWLEDGTAA